VLKIIEQIVLSIPNESEYYEMLDLCDEAIKKLGKLDELWKSQTLEEKARDGNGR